MKISIVIPTYNEEKRIEKTLTTYAHFYQNKKPLEVTLLVVLNGCTDNSFNLVKNIQKQYPLIQIIDLKHAGKGLAVKEGFKQSVKQDFDFIGFVDADMATHPEYFLKLIENIHTHDGIIASRYMKESKLVPPRPWIKNVGRTLIFNPMVRLLFWMHYVDFQCGAKLFKKHAIEKIAPKLSLTQWAFDIELLYLCKTDGFSIKEIPTTWYDQDHSKFNVVGSGISMIWAIIKLRLKYLR